MESTKYTIIILGILLAGIGFTIFLYIKNRKFYGENQIAIRKIYYGIVLVISYILWAFEKFPVKNVTELIMLVVSIVIIDLFVFQTPFITKFLSQEFKTTEAVETIKNVDNSLVEVLEKVSLLNRIMPKADEEWEIQNYDFSYQHYERYVLPYLTKFTDNFKMKLFMYYVEYSDEEPEPGEFVSKQFLQNTEMAYKKIREDQNFTIFGQGMRNNQVIEKLALGDNVEIIENNGTFIIFPFSGIYHNVLVVISSKSEVATHLADASLLLNLLHSLDDWLIINEKDLLPNIVGNTDDTSGHVAEVDEESENVSGVNQIGATTGDEAENTSS